MASPSRATSSAGEVAMVCRRIGVFLTVAVMLAVIAGCPTNSGEPANPPKFKDTAQELTPKTPVGGPKGGNKAASQGRGNAVGTPEMQGTGSERGRLFFAPAVVARSPDRATFRDRRSPGAVWTETFGRASGTVGRPCHNRPPHD